MKTKNTQTPFQRWALERLAAREWNPGDLHRALISAGEDMTEGYVYRIVQGSTGPNRPGYDIVLAIGQALGDARTALELAGYKLPKVEPRMDDSTRQWLELYAQRDEATRQRLLNVVQSILSMETSR